MKSLYDDRYATAGWGIDEYWKISYLLFWFLVLVSRLAGIPKSKTAVVVESMCCLGDFVISVWLDVVEETEDCCWQN